MSFITAFATMLASLVVLLVLAYILTRRELRRKLMTSSQIAQTSKGPIEYVDLGRGPVVLHAHGMLGGCDHWKYCEFLVQNGYRVIVPSRPGYLRTPVSLGRTPKEQAHLYAALLDALDIDHIAIYAVSQGGASALEFAQAYPNRCLELVLVSAFTRRTQGTEFNKVLPFLKTFMSLDFLMWLLEPILLPMLIRQAKKALPISDQQDAKKMKDIRAFFSTVFQARQRGTGLLNDFTNLLQWSGVPLNQLQLPTLVIHGTNDVFVKCEDSVATTEQISGARFLPLLDVGHEAFITQVDQIALETLALLQAYSPSQSYAG